MMEDRQFDELVKGLMENGTEEVPAGLWSAVESSLPASSKKVVPLWFRWTGVAVAAAAVAAAVVLAVVLPGRGVPANPVDVIGSDAVVAEANVAETSGQEPAVSAETEGTVSAEPAAEKPAAARPSSKAKAAAVKSVSETPAMEPRSDLVAQVIPAEENPVAETVKEEAVAEETREDDVQESTVNDDPVADIQESETFVAESLDFNESGREARERHASGFSLTLTGNANSNSNPKVSPTTVGPSFRSAAAQAPKSSTVVQTEESVFGVPLAIGLGFRYNFNERWSLGSGVNFTILSRAFAGNHIKVGEDGSVMSSEHYSNIRNNQVYFGVPVFAYCNIITNRIVDFYAYAGGEMDKCFYNKYLIQSASGKKVHEERYKSLQWSVKGGLGVEFIITDELGIFVDPQVGWYFKSKRDYSNIWNYQPLMFGVNLGLRLRI